MTPLHRGNNNRVREITIGRYTTNSNQGGGSNPSSITNIIGIVM